MTRPINWLEVQINLGPRYKGQKDGIPGPLTYAGLLVAVSGRKVVDEFCIKAGLILATQLPKYHISEGQDRLVQFLANTVHETMGYTRFSENLNYTNPARLVKIWPSRFNLASAVLYVRNPPKLAEKVYGGRYGNPPGRAYDYRGGGWIQTTFYDNYLAAQKVTGLPLVAHPELLHDPFTSIEPACAFWEGKGCNELADTDPSGEKARIRVNGGRIGLGEVKQNVRSITAWFV